MNEYHFYKLYNSSDIFSVTCVHCDKKLKFKYVEGAQDWSIRTFNCENCDFKIDWYPIFQSQEFLGYTLWSISDNDKFWSYDNGKVYITNRKLRSPLFETILTLDTNTISVNQIKNIDKIRMLQ